MAVRSLRSYFSFRGMLDWRAFARSYLIATCVAFGGAVAIFTPLTILIETMDSLGAIDPRLHLVFRRASIPVTVAIVMIPYVWVQIALCARRWRDIGVNPILGIGAWFGICLADNLLWKPHIAARYFAPFAQATPIGGALLATVLIILFAWPGRPRAGLAAATTLA